MKLTVSNIAKKYGVTTAAVGYWIKKGLKYETERVIGRKAHRVIEVDEVEKFLKLTKSRG